ncbi:hypothetical protein ACFP1Z_05610 [Streptomyces gamaensis]|uniref:Uncharacterized protein n=1 Tax=Streptomyces gamaensis TaxID=1763542 RepID=A0ABW0YZX4_9ACTN
MRPEIRASAALATFLLSASLMAPADAAPAPGPAVPAARCRPGGTGPCAAPQAGAPGGVRGGRLPGGGVTPDPATRAPSPSE